jgi:hypothetical protein
MLTGQVDSNGNADGIGGETRFGYPLDVAVKGLVLSWRSAPEWF